MADTKISDLTAATVMALADVVPTVQSGVTKKTTLQLIKDILQASLPMAYPVAVSDETFSLIVKDDAMTFRMPFAMTLTEVRASVNTAPTGSGITLDIEDGGTTIFSTLLTIDATEKTSTTAAVPSVLSDTAIADDAEISINIDAVGSTIAGTGLKVTFIGTRQ